MVFSGPRKYADKLDRRAQDCSQSEDRSEGREPEKRPKWYDRTSVTLSVAAGLIVIGCGFIHVITGVVSPYNLPFDVVLKESFGYAETFVDAAKIKALPYSAAKLKYPLGCKVLQRHSYMDFGDAFEAKMTRRLQEDLNEWQEEFDQALETPQPQWQDELRERPDVGQVGPEDPNAYNRRGIAAAREGRYEAALAAFTRAFQKDPGFAEAYYNRGLVSITIGLLGQGVSDFGKVVEIKPGLVDAYEKRGCLCFAMKQYDEAISDFTKIMELDPIPKYFGHRAIFRRSLAHYAKGEYDPAWKDVHRIQNLGLPIPGGYLRVLRLVSEMDK
ncbi:MAG: tetratricopeptide repeat protein [Sedimentisphaerales bacterium]